MFTGIIEEQGEFIQLRQTAGSASLVIRAHLVLQGTKVGDSIAVDGVCLTVTEMQGDRFYADVMPETLRRSTLGGLEPGDPVNLERAMAADGRFGGHIVAGHVDGTGVISRLRNEGNAVLYTVSADPSVLRYIVEKGSVAIDGISLTVVQVTGNDFTVSVIPHTNAVTGLSRKKAGDKVNLENDIIGKYVERLMRPEETKQGVTMDFLAEHGFL